MSVLMSDTETRCIIPCSRDCFNCPFPDCVLDVIRLLKPYYGIE